METIISKLDKTSQQEKMSPENRLKIQGPTRLSMQESQKSTTLKTSKCAQDLVQNCVGPVVVMDFQLLELDSSLLSSCRVFKAFL